MRDVLFYYPPFCIIYGLYNVEYLMRGCEKACQKAVAPVNIKTAIFSLQYLIHFCMDYNITNMSRSAIRQPFQ